MRLRGVGKTSCSCSGCTGEMARAVSQDLIKLRVPYAYRYNPERYIRVARLIPIYETQEQHGRYRRRLNKMLLDPTDPWPEGYVLADTWGVTGTVTQ